MSQKNKNVIQIDSVVPSDTTDKLYNDNGNLYWDGLPIAAGTGNIEDGTIDYTVPAWNDYVGQWQEYTDFFLQDVAGFDTQGGIFELEVGPSTFLPFGGFVLADGSNNYISGILDATSLSGTKQAVLNFNDDSGANNTIGIGSAGAEIAVDNGSNSCQIEVTTTSITFQTENTPSSNDDVININKNYIDINDTNTVPPTSDSASGANTFISCGGDGAIIASNSDNNAIVASRTETGGNDLSDSLYGFIAASDRANLINTDYCAVIASISECKDGKYLATIGSEFGRIEDGDNSVYLGGSGVLDLNSFNHVVGLGCGSHTAQMNNSAIIDNSFHYKLTHYSATTIDSTDANTSITIATPIILVDTTASYAAGNVTINTPSVAGLRVDIKDISGNANTNNVTLATQGPETIDGQATYVLSSNYESVTLYWDGSNWYII